MKWPPFGLLVACGFAAVSIVLFIASYLVSPTGSIAAAARPKDVAMAYACGYLDGISHAPITPPKHLDWCDEYTKTAHENGFNP